jgi:phytoene desaturase
MKQTIAIIGSGIGGLATAALLAKKGHDVTIYEKNETVGGRAMQTKINGYVFDRGPSWYLMPDVFERYFAIFGKTPGDFFQLKKLDPHYRIFWDEKGDLSDVSSDMNKNLALFESLEPGCTPRVLNYLEKAKYQYEVSMREFLYTSFDKAADFLKPKLAFEAMKLNLFESLDRHTRRFFSSDKLRKILQYTNVFLGGSPRNTPALFSLMSHVDFAQGVYYPMGGIYEVVKALQNLCLHHGVTIRTNAPITHLEIVKKKATLADIVVSNADYAHTETQLLDCSHQTYPQSYWDQATIAPSAFMMYLGVKGKVKNLIHHNLFFHHDWERHFDDIFERPSWPKDPSYYVCVPSKTDPSVMPDQENENIFILVPVAPGLDDTDEMREDFAKKILSHLEMITGDTIQDRIETKLIHSQRDFASLFNAYKGTALGLSHTLLQSAFFRPRNKSSKVRNLYFVGQYTVPGIGIPMCLISAQVVAERIQRELNG